MQGAELSGGADDSPKLGAESATCEEQPQSPSSSNSGENPRSCQSFLPTVHEDLELECASERDETNSNKEWRLGQSVDPQLGNSSLLATAAVSGGESCDGGNSVVTAG